MTPDQTIRALLAGTAAGPPEEEARALERVAARILWFRGAIDRLQSAQQRVQDAWDRIFDALPDDIDDEELEAMDIPDPPEQAELDAIHAEIDAVREKDLWPRELYWGGL